MILFFVPSGYPNELYPNANVFLKEQVYALSKIDDYEIIVLNVAQKGGRKIFTKVPKEIQIIKNEKITEYRIWVSTFKQELFPSIYSIICSNALKKLYECAKRDYGKPDIIYAHFGFYAGDAIGKIVGNDSVPIVLMEHYSYLMRDRISSTILKMEKNAIQNATVCCCVSNNLKDKLVEHLEYSVDEDKMIVVQNMVNPIFKYKPLIEKESFVFCSVGNLNKRKQFDLLIKGFIKAFSADDKVELRIGGNGEEHGLLQDLIEENNRGNQIKLLGSLDRKSVLKLNANSNCFVMMSKSETFGIVYREALAVGRPIITSNHGGFDEKFDCRDGIMVMENEPDALADAFKKIYNNYNSYNLKDISRRCIERFSEEVILNELKDVFNSVLKSEEIENGKAKTNILK